MAVLLWGECENGRCACAAGDVASGIGGKSDEKSP